MKPVLSWRSKVSWTKRSFDVVAALVILLVLMPALLLLAVLIRVTSKGPALHWSNRVGKENRIFEMPKFRSMHIEAPLLPTHLLSDPGLYLTSVGSFIRRTSLDECPQLFSILIGHMSFVGPRPALFSQSDLVTLRTKGGVHLLAPGLTGWAQVNGRDELSMTAKVHYDYEYLQRQSFNFDLKIIGLTVVRVLQKKDVTH